MTWPFMILSNSRIVNMYNYRAMSRKKHGVKYNLKTAQSTADSRRRIRKGFMVNPFANGFKNMTAMEFVAKETSEKYRRIKK